MGEVWGDNICDNDSEFCDTISPSLFASAALDGRKKIGSFLVLVVPPKVAGQGKLLSVAVTDNYSAKLR
jgi:hypothetical protein